MTREEFVAKLEVAAASRSGLSAFGKLARYLFMAGLMSYMEGNQRTKGLNKISDLKAQAWSYLEKETLKKMGCPVEVLRKDTDMDDMRETHIPRLRRWFRKTIQNDPDVAIEEKTLFAKSILLVTKAETSTTSGLRGTGKIAWALSDQLGTIFDRVVNLGGEDGGDSAKTVLDLHAALQDAVKKLTGKKGFLVSAEELRNIKAKGKQPDEVNEYARLKRSIRDQLEVALRNLSGKDPIDVDEAEEELKKLNFKDIPFPSGAQGFTGMVGMLQGKMSLYSPDGKQLSGNIPAKAEVKMNSRYDSEADNTYVLSYTAPNAVGQTRLYTLKRTSTNQINKHQAVADNEGKVKKWKATWVRDMKTDDPMRNVPAAACLILYLTGARVGSSTSNRSAKGAAQTYGVISLLSKHVKIKSNVITLSYIGKKGMAQKHVIAINNTVTKRLRTILLELKEGKKPADLLFSFERPTSPTGKTQILNYAFFKKYASSTGLKHIHGLRHIRGTILVKQLLAKKAWKPLKKWSLSAKQREAEKYIKNVILTPAAKLLGHKSGSGGSEKVAWSTTAKSYIQPAVLINFFVDNKLQVPKWVPKHEEAIS